MTTNYYFREEPACPTCLREYEPLHIGMSAKGWCFQLHVIPSMGLTSWEAWEKVLAAAPSYRIFDEYDRPVRYEELADIVKLREGSYDRATDCGRDYSWFSSNRAEKGPRGLVRCKVDGVHCVGHDGDVDLIAGEFS